MRRRRFRQSRRNAARFALYASFAVVGFLTLAFYPVFRPSLHALLDTEWYGVDYAALDEVQLLQGLLQIDTTAKTGSELRAAEYLAETLEAAGIPSHLERLGEDKANLWAILEGEDPQALVLHNHLDVDPIRQPERWRHSPFSGKIEPPWIYGRGAFDMKSVTIAQLSAFTAAAEEARRQGRPPARSLIFLATSSEETGSDLGVRWLIRQHPELVARFWAVLTEGGVLEATTRSHIKYWGTETGQKRFVEAVACSDSRTRLEDFLADLRERGQPFTHRSLSTEVRSFLEVYGPSRDHPQYRGLLAAPETIVEDPTRLLTLPPYLRALFRSEIHPFPVQERPDGNGYQLRLVFHLVPGDELEEVQARLLPEWMTLGLTLHVDPVPTAEGGSPVDHPVLQGIHRVLDDLFAPEHRGPYYLQFSATDARFFRLAGIPTYGFTPFVILSTDSLTITGPDERLALPAYVEGVRLYEELVRRLVGEAEI